MLSDRKRPMKLTIHRQSVNPIAVNPVIGRRGTEIGTAAQMRKTTATDPFSAHTVSPIDGALAT